MHKIYEEIARLSRAYFGEMVVHRRYLHQNPELSKQEFNTAKYIIEQLDKIGVSEVEQIADTGVVALIRGGCSGSDCIALRADMDALPILEKSGAEYCSTNAGVMHACGHDAHTAVLLGTAHILQNIRADFGGVVKLIFQPSEEHYPGGAIRMIEAGVLKNPAPKAIFGLHCDPQLDTGQIGMKPGKYMASTDELYLTVKGTGGHGALPETCIDPVVVTAHIITALQTIVSRSANPTLPTVLTFGKMVASGRTNIIPNEVKLEGIVRTFDESWRTTVHKKVEEISQGIARSMGADCELFVDPGYPYLSNDETLTNSTFSLAQQLFGVENIKLLDLRMTAEDFAYFAQKVPACYFRLGTRNSEKGFVSMLHSDTFDLDEDALKIGAQAMATFALSNLEF